MNVIAASLREVLGELEAHLAKLDSFGNKVLLKRLIDRLRAVLDALSRADNVRRDAQLHKLLGDLLAAAKALLEALQVYLRSLKGTPQEQSRAQGLLVDAMSDLEAALDAIDVALGLGPNPSVMPP